MTYFDVLKHVKPQSKKKIVLAGDSVKSEIGDDKIKSEPSTDDSQDAIPTVKKEPDKDSTDCIHKLTIQKNKDEQYSIKPEAESEFSDVKEEPEGQVDGNNSDHINEAKLDPPDKESSENENKSLVSDLKDNADKDISEESKSESLVKESSGQSDNKSEATSISKDNISDNLISETVEKATTKTDDKIVQEVDLGVSEKLKDEGKDIEESNSVQKDAQNISEFKTTSVNSENSQIDTEKATGSIDTKESNICVDTDKINILENIDKTDGKENETEKKETADSPDKCDEVDGAINENESKTSKNDIQSESKQEMSELTPDSVHGKITDNSGGDKNQDKSNNTKTTEFVKMEKSSLEETEKDGSKTKSLESGDKNLNVGMDKEILPQTLQPGSEDSAKFSSVENHSSVDVKNQTQSDKDNSCETNQNLCDKNKLVTPNDQEVCNDKASSGLENKDIKKLSDTVQSSASESIGVEEELVNSSKVTVNSDIKEPGSMNINKNNDSNVTSDNVIKGVPSDSKPEEDSKESKPITHTTEIEPEVVIDKTITEIENKNVFDNENQGSIEKDNENHIDDKHSDPSVKLKSSKMDNESMEVLADSKKENTIKTLSKHDVVVEDKEDKVVENIMEKESIPEDESAICESKVLTETTATVGKETKSTVPPGKSDNNDAIQKLENKNSSKLTLENGAKCDLDKPTSEISKEDNDTASTVEQENVKDVQAKDTPSTDAQKEKGDKLETKTNIEDGNKPPTEIDTQPTGTSHEKGDKAETEMDNEKGDTSPTETDTPSTGTNKVIGDNPPTETDALSNITNDKKEDKPEINQEAPSTGLSNEKADKSSTETDTPSASLNNEKENLEVNTDTAPTDAGNNTTTQSIGSDKRKEEEKSTKKNDKSVKMSKKNDDKPTEETKAKDEGEVQITSVLKTTKDDIKSVEEADKPTADTKPDEDADTVSGGLRRSGRSRRPPQPTYTTEYIPSTRKRGRGVDRTPSADTAADNDQEGKKIKDQDGAKVNGDIPDDDKGKMNKCKGRKRQLLEDSLDSSSAPENKKQRDGSKKVISKGSTKKRVPSRVIQSSTDDETPLSTLSQKPKGRKGHSPTKAKLFEDSDDSIPTPKGKSRVS